jgi:hypothetical protein
MSLRSFPLRLGRTAAGLAVFMAVAAVAAYGSATPNPQLGSLATVNLCIHKAGPEKGAVRFVQKKSYCKAAELRVGVLGEASTQAALGLDRTGTYAAGSRSVPAGATGYLRIESTSPSADGAPESAGTTAACPAGRYVVGGGYRVDAGPPAVGNNPAAVVVTESRVISDTTWSVTAFAGDAEQVGPWSVVAYAICANAGA